MSDCIFCQIAEGKIPGEKLYENDNFFSVKDINPKVEGHSVVISKKHFESILDMPNTLANELMDCVKKTSLKLMDELKATGVNVASNVFESAGQVVKHVHVHILPRKDGDGFNFGV